MTTPKNLKELQADIKKAEFRLASLRLRIEQRQTGFRLPLQLNGNATLVEPQPVNR